MHATLRRAVVVGAIGLICTAFPTSANGKGTIFVDDDHQQCKQAQFTSIQAAVLAAPSGGHIHVCPGLYPETVTVDRPLRIEGAGPAPAQRTGDPLTEAVVQTPDRGFHVLASDSEVTGFTVFGDASMTIGIDVSPFGTGNTVRRNFVRGHVIGVELSVGGPDRRPSLIADNRIEDSSFGIAIDDNLGPAPDVTPAELTIRHNTLSNDATGILLQRMRGVQVKGNTLTDFSQGIDVRQSTEISVLQNDLETGGFSATGISLRNDTFDTVFGNEVRGRFNGPAVAGIHLDGSQNDLVANNRIRRMRGDGVLLSTTSHNVVLLNRSDENGNDGIQLQDSPENQLLLNAMHDNAVFDAADDNRDDNVWEHNRCDTDSPPGTICTRGH
ncbi:MAG: right-handed parallel beta-helix repeat-containing protein [Myxococcaceae bacterium]|nr:right-handed parallel beta-helix repeat-containing protein [Myxococcaceae bacterium]